MKWALYDLSYNPPSFDFAQFAQHAMHRGAEGVYFKRGKTGRKKAFGDGEDERFETIVLPLCKAFGLQYEIVDSVDNDFEPCFPHGKVVAHSHDLRLEFLPPKPFPAMPTKEALDRAEWMRGKIVVHLRRMTRQYHWGRNSSPDWDRWAADHDAVVVPDYDQKPISIDERLAYCELASVNMGINSGVMVLSMLSERPFLVMKMINEEYKVTSTKYLEKIGFPVGSQLPWSGKNQKIVWNDKDDYATIEEQFRLYEYESSSSASDQESQEISGGRTG